MCLLNDIDRMKHLADSPKGKAIFRHRSSVAEPVFGNTGTKKRLNRFRLQGRKKVLSQRQLNCLVRNIE